MTALNETVIKEVPIPDIGGATDVTVIEIAVTPGDEVAKDDSLLTLEGDKATMDIPAPFAGIIKELKVSVGEQVAEGKIIMIMDAAQAMPKADRAPAAAKATSQPPPTIAVSAVAEKRPHAPLEQASPDDHAGGVHAGPAVRRIAREFGVDLNALQGTGRKGRIVKEDVQAFVKSALSQSNGAAGAVAIAPRPAVDFSRFGEIETKALNKIKRLTGTNLHRNWATIPHVTQNEEVDITELEQFRKAQKAAAEAQGVKVTPLVFIMKAVVDALRTYPQFNASLSPKGDELILKKYFHIGVAVDTPNGLVVPVIRDVDQKSVFSLAEELGAISKKAREKGLTMAEMEGSSFTLSSLGGIGGTSFTPIVNAPDVAILGVSRAKMAPVYQDGTFVPRLLLPLSLSYDHRVIDGAEGARFIVHLAKSLQSLKCLLV